jgi:hypothetical protein
MRSHLRQKRTSREGLANVGDKIVRMLAPDRHANQRRSNSDFTTGLFREPGMHCRRGVANQRFRSAQTDRQFGYLTTIEESERVRLISFDVEGECRTGRTGLPTITFCVGRSAGSKGGAKTSALMFPQPRDGSDHRC